LSEAVELATELRAKQVFFTHMSHQIGFHDEVNASLPEHMQLAYDGLTIEL
jgi:phosphoribosyl 1,2-cyclic phosphate phosphodiesterase